MSTSLAMNPIFVYGASGHGKVVADILEECGLELAGFIDDDVQKRGKWSGRIVFGDFAWLAARKRSSAVAIALGIGDNFARHRVAHRCLEAGVPLVTAIHPSAVIARSAKIAAGTVVMAQAVVNADAEIGQGAIINTAAVVEHDCRLGNFSHLSPRSAIGGNVRVGDCSWLGIGSTVNPGLTIGTGAIVGAGATVIRNVEDWVVAVGIPARVLRAITPRTETA